MATTTVERAGEDYDSLHCYIQQVGVEIENVLDGNSNRRVVDKSCVSTQDESVIRSNGQHKQRPSEADRHVRWDPTKKNGWLGPDRGDNDNTELSAHLVQNVRKERSRNDKEADTEFKRRKAAICFGIGDFRPSRENSPKEVLFRNLSEQGDRKDEIVAGLYSNGKKYKRSLSDSIRPLIENGNNDGVRVSPSVQNGHREEKTDGVLMRRSYSNIANNDVQLATFIYNRTKGDVESSHVKRENNRSRLGHSSERLGKNSLENLKSETDKSCDNYCTRVYGMGCKCEVILKEGETVDKSEEDRKKQQRAKLLSQIYEDVKRVTRPFVEKDKGNVKHHRHHTGVQKHSNTNAKHHIQTSDKHQNTTKAENSNHTRAKHHHQHHSPPELQSNKYHPSCYSPSQHSDQIVHHHLINSAQNAAHRNPNQSKQKTKYDAMNNSASQQKPHKRSQEVDKKTDININSHYLTNAQPAPSPSIFYHQSPKHRVRGYSDSDLDYLQDFLDYDILQSRTDRHGSDFKLDHETRAHQIGVENATSFDPGHSLYQRVVKPKGSKFRRVFSSEDSLIIPPPPGFGSENDVFAGSSHSVTQLVHDDAKPYHECDFLDSPQNDYFSELLKDLVHGELQLPNQSTGSGESVRMKNLCSSVGDPVVDVSPGVKVGLPNNAGLFSPEDAAKAVDINKSGNPIAPLSSSARDPFVTSPTTIATDSNNTIGKSRDKSPNEGELSISSYQQQHAGSLGPRCEDGTGSNSTRHCQELDGSLHDPPGQETLLDSPSGVVTNNHNELQAVQPVLGQVPKELSHLESFTNDLSESSYNILTYSSDSFQTDECDISSRCSDLTTNSQINIDCDCDYLKTILQSPAIETLTYERLDSQDTFCYVPTSSQNYFENPLNCNEVTRQTAISRLGDMSTGQGEISNGSYHKENARVFWNLEKIQPQDVIGYKQVSTGVSVPVEFNRKLSSDLTENLIRQEDQNNNQVCSIDRDGHATEQSKSINDNHVDKKEFRDYTKSRKDSKRHRLKDTAIQTSLDLEDTVDISGMPASQSVTVKRLSISQGSRMSKEQSPPKHIMVGGDVYSTIDKSNKRVPKVDKGYISNSDEKGPELPPRKKSVSRSKSLQSGQNKKTKKVRMNCLEKPSLSGSLRELSHLNIDVSQRLVDGERQYVVDNGSLEMQMIVNALTPVLLRRSKSGRASGKRRFDSSGNRPRENKESQGDDNVFEESIPRESADGYIAGRMSHSDSGKLKTLVETPSCQNSTSEREGNVVERVIPIYARIRSHDGSHSKGETKKVVRRKDFYEISNELKKISIGKEFSVPKNRIDKKQKVTKTSEGKNENLVKKDNKKEEERLFLDPKQAHTWHGQGITDFRYRPAPRMGVGMVFIETTKLLGGSEVSRHFRNNQNFSISSTSPSTSSSSTHTQTLPVISRTLLDAMHKRYCSHQYARHAPTTLQPFSILKIDPSSSHGGEPITALRVEPRSPKDHEVTANPVSLASSSAPSKPAASLHTKRIVRLTSDGESDSRSSTTESVQSSPRQQKLSESDTQRTELAVVSLSKQSSRANSHYQEKEAVCESSQHKNDREFQQRNSESDELLPDSNNVNHRKNSRTQEEFQQENQKVEGSVQCANIQESAITLQQPRTNQERFLQQQRRHLFRLQQQQQSHHHALPPDHQHHHRTQHFHHCQDQYLDVLPTSHRPKHPTSLDLDSVSHAPLPSSQPEVEERFSHHGKSTAGEYLQP